jgi:MFS family permease
VRFIARDSLLRVWVPSLTVVDSCWTAFFACLPVLVVARYHAHPEIYGTLMGGLGLGALIGAFVALRFVRDADPLKMTAASFLCQIASIWMVALPAPWYVAVAGMACAGFFMSLVNSPMQALMMLRMPPDVRPHAMAVNGVLSFTFVPLALVVVGWALTHHSPRPVIGVVLALQTVAIVSIVSAALAERTALRAATVDSPA